MIVLSLYSAVTEDQCPCVSPGGFADFEININIYIYIGIADFESLP